MSGTPFTLLSHALPPAGTPYFAAYHNGLSSWPAALVDALYLMTTGFCQLLGKLLVVLSTEPLELPGRSARRCTVLDALEPVIV
ncbi:hypothetical protein D3C81_1674940 [compost metagenome]